MNDALQQVIGVSNVNLPGGALRGQDSQYLIRTINEFDSVAEISDLIISQREGATVRLAEGESLEAEQLAAKSNSLAAGNRSLQARNWELIAQARHYRGDPAGARAAEQRAHALDAR